MKNLIYILLGILGLTTLSFASDPTWYTDLTTQLTTIGGYVVAVLGSVITIRLAPLAWKYVSQVLNRG